VRPAALAACFERIRARGSKALAAYLMSGFPTRHGFRALAHQVLENGADLLEIGVPFSDPLADGKVIQAAGQIALQQGARLEWALEDAAALRARWPAVPLVLMSYLNRHGLDGWIVPDRDLDRPGEVLLPAAREGLDVIPLVAPTTPPARLPHLLRGAAGFVYLVSVTGVTGTRRGSAGRRPCPCWWGSASRPESRRRPRAASPTA
jgi:tryptophan synthase alpha chain